MTDTNETQVEVTPDAYLYRNDEGSKELILNCNSEYARRLLEHGYTETPLFARIQAEKRNNALAVELRALADGIGDCEIVAHQLRGAAFHGTANLVEELPAILVALEGDE